MLKIGLTGNRYSGKKTISKIFKSINIPVFDADIVLKLLLNYNNSVKSKIGMLCEFSSEEFYTNGFLDPLKINSDDFIDIIKIAEFELKKEYEKFNLKNSSALYTIFKSSILFESDLYKHMDYNISIFAPKNIRNERCKFLTGLKNETVLNNMGNEFDDLEKNKNSKFIIHNYDNYRTDIITQICDIDNSIIDIFLKSDYVY